MRREWRQEFVTIVCVVVVVVVHGIVVAVVCADVGCHQCGGAIGTCVTASIHVCTVVVVATAATVSIVVGVGTGVVVVMGVWCVLVRRAMLMMGVVIVVGLLVCWLGNAFVCVCACVYAYA
jgi:hypothetical protein